MQVGFIGLGSQGGPMAHMIERGGFPLMLWARRPESLEPYRSSTASFAATPAELGAACDVVGICVVNDADVEAVVVEQRLLDAMKPGSVLAIHSTVTPQTCARLGELARSRGVHLLDAPVSGSGEAAYAGTLAVMVGGDAEVLERVRPVLSTFGNPVTRVGDVGAGQLLKLVNNEVFTANLILAAEALDLAVGFGIDRAAALQMIGASSGRSFALGVIERMIGAGAAHGVALLAKDIALVQGAAGERGVAAPVLDRVAAEALAMLEARSKI